MTEGEKSHSDRPRDQQKDRSYSQRIQLAADCKAARTHSQPFCHGVGQVVCHRNDGVTQNQVNKITLPKYNLDRMDVSQVLESRLGQSNAMTDGFGRVPGVGQSDNLPDNLSPSTIQLLNSQLMNAQNQQNAQGINNSNVPTVSNTQ